MAEVPTSDWSWIDSAAVRFEQEWKKGTRPRIEEFLADLDEPRKPPLLEELLRVERELLERAGEAPDVDEYRRRFPNSLAVINAVFNPTPVAEIDPATTGPITPSRDRNGDQTPAPGTTVRYFGDYELIREIGRGGMGVVFKARQISLNRPVALKMIRSAALASEDELRRFQNEAEAIALLDHPHIVPILEVGNHEGQRYFSMKLIAGSRLDQSLARYTTDPKSAAKLLQKAAQAVHHAHQRGILHRDLKPANILLDEHGEPFVTDFGLAKRVEGDSELTHSGAIMGTPAFMAPEQASGRRGAVTTSSDVYGLGAILYALLTGRAPFTGDSIDETLEQVRSATPLSPAKLNPRAPRDLEVIALKCLEKDPARRYASALSLADDLGRFLAGEPIAARPTGPLERGWLWCKRNPWLAGALSTAAAALVAVAFFALLFAREQSRSAVRDRQIAEKETKDRIRTEELNDKLIHNSQKLTSAVKESNTRLAVMNFERAEAALAKNEVAPALLWLAESWRSANLAESPGWQHTARGALSGWLRNFRPVRASFGVESKVLRFGFVPDVEESSSVDFKATGGVIWAAFSPDGRKVLALNAAGIAAVWDAETSKPIGKPMPIGNSRPNGMSSALRPLGRPRSPRAYDRIVAFKPDGGILLLGNFSPYHSAQLWDGSTGNPLGKPLQHFNEQADDPIASNRDEITEVALSPDGATAITVGTSTALLWNTATGEPIGEPMRHAGPIESMDFSPDGRTALTTSPDDEDQDVAQLWETATAKPLGPPLKHSRKVAGPFGRGGGRLELGAMFSPNARTVLTTYGQEATLWHTGTGRPTGSPMQLRCIVTAMAFSPDSKKLLIAGISIPVGGSVPTPGEAGVQFWDASTGQSIGVENRRFGIINHAAFSPDSLTAVTTGGSEVRLWDAAAGMPIRGPVRSEGYAAFSPDGRFILTAEHTREGAGTRGKGQLWDATTGAQIGPPMEHPAGISTAAFSPDGRTVMTGCSDGLVRLWDVERKTNGGLPIDHQGQALDFELAVWSVAGSDRGELRTSVPEPSPNDGPAPAKIALSPDGRTIVTAHGPTARIWDLATGKPTGPLMRHQGRVGSVAFSPDGRTILTAAGFTAQLWDPKTGQALGPPMGNPRRVLVNLESSASNGWISYAMFSPDGRTVLTASDDGTVQLWDALTSEPIGTRIRHFDRPLPWRLTAEAHFSPDSRSLMTEHRPGAAARLWNATTCKPIGTLPLNSAANVTAFSPAGNILVIANDTTARLWDLATGSLVGRPMVHSIPDGFGNTYPVTHVVFSPDGSTVLTRSSEGRARLWDVATCDPRGPMLVPPRQAGAFISYSFSAAFSPSGHTVVTTDETAAWQWDAATATPVGVPMTHPSGPAGGHGISHVSFSSDGQTILTAGLSEARLWNAATAKSLGPPMETPGRTRLAFAQLAIAALSRDGQLLLTDVQETARLWDVSLLPDEADRVSLWLQVVTGLTVAEPGVINALDAAEWRQRREQLAQLGGPPNWGPRWSLDTVLAGDEPTARTHEALRRERWADAKKAFDDAVRERPLNADILVERGQFLLEQGMTSAAHDDFVEAFGLGKLDNRLLDRLIDNESLFLRACARYPWTTPRLADIRARLQAIKGDWAGASTALRTAVAYTPDDSRSRHHLILTLLAAGDFDAARQVRGELLDRFGSTTEPGQANEIARAAALVPGPVDRIELCIQLAQRAVDRADANLKSQFNNAVGALLYRAGRFEDAIARLQQGTAGAWAILSLAHHRLGHQDEARRRLSVPERILELRASAVWDELEIRVLQSEAAAVILYDPVFPANPFAR